MSTTISINWYRPSHDPDRSSPVFCNTVYRIFGYIVCCNCIYRAMSMHSADYAVARCLTVRHTPVLCLNDYAYPISLKLGDIGLIGSTDQKYWLTIGGDPVPPMDSGSVFLFFHRCGIRDFRRLINISHPVIGRVLRYLAKETHWLSV